jgi:hypothetical protein
MGKAMFHNLLNKGYLYRRGCALVGTLLALVAASGCASLEQEVQQLADEWRESLQAEVEQAIKDALSGLGDALEEVLADAAASVNEWAHEQGDAFEEWLGLEAPDGLGILKGGSQTQLDQQAIRDAFLEAFKKAGGARVLGWPSLLASLENGAIIQHFENGAILMADERDAAAYYMLEDWYDVYYAAGGTADAGLPTSNPETWGASLLAVWARDARGKRQAMSLDGNTYALMQPAGMEEVYLVPPDFWDAYLDGGGYGELGYPLSSFPLDEGTAVKAVLGLDELSNMIATWQERPYRIQIFTRGSLWFDPGLTKSEVVLAEPIGHFFGEETLLLERIGTEFKKLKYDLIFSEGCLPNTITYAGSATLGEAVSNMITKVALIPLESALAVVPVSSVKATLGKIAAQALVAMAGSDDLDEESLWFGVGVLADSYFSKAVGDLLAAPLGTLTTESLQITAESLDQDRVTSSLDWETSTNINAAGHIAATYDPRTHMISGVMKLDNACPSYAFQMRAEPYAGELLTDPVWAPSTPEFFDLDAMEPAR